MSKVFHITLMVEVEDDAAPLDQWNWPGHLLSFPGIRGFTFVKTQERPFASMEHDPLCNSQH